MCIKICFIIVYLNFCMFKDLAYLKILLIFDNFKNFVFKHKKHPKSDIFTHIKESLM